MILIELGQYLDNEIIISFVYSLIVSILAFLISISVEKLYRFSKHKGIYLFRLVFIFFSVAFFSQVIIILTNYWLSHLFDLGITTDIANKLFIRGLFFLFSYTVSLSGFYIVYSLIWKKFEFRKNLKNLPVVVIHLLSIIIAFIYSSGIPFSRDVLFIPQLLLISSGIYICLKKYKKIRNKKKYSVLQLYIITLILMLIGWSFNYITDFVEPIFPYFSFYTQLITVSIFGIILFGVVKIIRKF